MNMSPVSATIPAAGTCRSQKGSPGWCRALALTAMHAEAIAIFRPPCTKSEQLPSTQHAGKNSNLVA